MRGCFPSFRLPSPVLDVPCLRSIPPDSRRRLPWIRRTIINVSGVNHVSIGKFASFSSSNARFQRLSRAFDSEGLGFHGELGFKGLDPSSLDFFPGNDEQKKQKRTKGSAKEDDLVRLKGDDDWPKTALRGGGKQTMKRSNLVAKQLISIQSALSLGFISQLWVDTTSWEVLVVEVKPNLLAGESERFLLKDIARVGDVVLVEDEIVLENDFRMVGLETLVGYKVVTLGQQSIGKVRGYTFDINSGTVDSLEIDSFGISIIPTSLVSTFALHVEDIHEVLSDIVVVEESSASRIQRLTKGLWDARHVATCIDEELERPGRRRQRRKRRGIQSNRSRRKKRDFGGGDDDDDDDWGIPLDFL